jgi:SNF2 family DNA or RNA helicase
MTKGSIEEHINVIIERKGRLMEDVVTVDDHQLLKQFDRKEIISLLQLYEQ